MVSVAFQLPLPQETELPVLNGYDAGRSIMSLNPLTAEIFTTYHTLLPDLLS
jgi:hypothetical protein